MIRFGALVCLLVGGASGIPICEVDSDISSLIQISSIPVSPHSYMVWHTAKAFEAPENNLGGTGPLSGPEVLRFHNVSMFYLDENVDDQGMVLDLLIQTETTYTNNNDPNKNGEHGEFGAIQFEGTSSTTFTWSFVKTGTYEKVVIPDFAIMFYDLDNKAGRPPCDESITAWNVHSYALVPDAFTTVTEEAADRLLVCSNAPDSVPNPRAVNALSDDQKKASVMLSFQDTAEFVLTLANNHTGKRKFQFSGPSSSFLESATWTRASPTAAPTRPPPTAAPTKLPTVTPTPSPTTGSPTATPIASPTPRPTASPTTASPTSSPTSSPTRAEPTAFGDPHVMNVAGEKFNIQRAGNHTFLTIPRGADLEVASLQMHATVHLRGEECVGQLYITEISLLGKWLGNFRSFQLSAGTEEFNTPEVVGLRVGESDKVSVEEFINWVSPEIADAQRFAAEMPRSVNQHAATLLMRLHLGPLTIKVTWAHTKEKVGFSNSLMLVVAGLAEVQGSVGGLLGEDSHAWAASEPANCSRGMVSPLVQTLLQKPDRRGVSARATLSSE